MTSHDYLIEMSFDPFASPLTPQEATAFAERVALPTFEALRKMAGDGRVLAGGPLLAAVGLAFIARAESPQELEEMVGSLPLFPRARTRVVPLGTFEGRVGTIRGFLDKATPASPQPAQC